MQRFLTLCTFTDLFDRETSNSIVENNNIANLNGKIKNLLPACNFTEVDKNSDICLHWSGKVDETINNNPIIHTEGMKQLLLVISVNLLTMSS